MAPMLNLRVVWPLICTAQQLGWGHLWWSMDVGLPIWLLRQGCNVDSACRCTCMRRMPLKRGFWWSAGPAVSSSKWGPVPQGVLDSRVVTQTQLALEACLAVLSEACSGDAPQPRDLVVHRHLRSLDLPRDAQGQPSALLHPLCQGSDWRPLTAGAPLLRRMDGSATVVPDDAAGLTPVFINAAYARKRIALSLTRREVWPVDPGWIKALGNLMLG